MSSVAVRRRLVALALAGAVAVSGIVAWVLNGSGVNDWLAVHTGIRDVSGPWYGFWSGFGSDLTEFGIIGAVSAGVYQMARKYNCHEPGCWRVGTHPAAGGQFLLCYRHHPDFQGIKPTHDVIARLHADHVRRQDAIHEQLHELRQNLSRRVEDGDDHNGVDDGTASMSAPAVRRDRG